MIDRATGKADAATGGANTQFDDLVEQANGKGNRPTNGDDTLNGTNRSDFILGKGGNDTINGRGGNDFLSGGAGNDTIRTGKGKDFVLGGSGDDRVIVQGSAYVDGGKGRDTVVLKGAESDYTQQRGFRGTQVYTTEAGDRVVLRNVEKVRFSEPVAPPPPPPPVGKGQALGPNDAGAERIIIGPDSVRIVGPNTDFTFTNLTDRRPVDGPLTAAQGSGIINGVETTAVPIGDSRSVVLSIGSGFNPTGTQGVNAAFASGVRLDTQILREDGPITPPEPPTPPLPPAGGLPLEPNSIGAERLIVSPGSVRLIGPGTDFTFTGITDGRPADGPLTATGGSGTIQGVETTAVPLGLSNPFDPGASAVVFSLGSGFNVTGTQGVRAAFANGAMLDTAIART